MDQNRFFRSVSLKLLSRRFMWLDRYHGTCRILGGFTTGPAALCTCQFTLKKALWNIRVIEKIALK